MHIIVQIIECIAREDPHSKKLTEFYDDQTKRMTLITVYNVQETVTYVLGLISTLKVTSVCSHPPMTTSETTL